MADAPEDFDLFGGVLFLRITSEREFDGPFGPGCALIWPKNFDFSFLHPKFAE